MFKQVVKWLDISCEINSKLIDGNSFNKQQNLLGAVEFRVSQLNASKLTVLS